MSGRLQNRVCLITGSTGIGAATARLAASEGATVFVVSRDEESCRALAGDRLRLPCRRPDAIRRSLEAVESCLARRDRIDALFNVAGVSGRKFGDGPVHECSEEGWEITMETNVKSVFLMCRAVVGECSNSRKRERHARFDPEHGQRAGFLARRSFSPRTLMPQARARSSV